MFCTGSVLDRPRHHTFNNLQENVHNRLSQYILLCRTRRRYRSHAGLRGQAADASSFLPNPHQSYKGFLVGCVLILLMRIASNSCFHLLLLSACVLCNIVIYLRVNVQCGPQQHRFFEGCVSTCESTCGYAAGHRSASFGWKDAQRSTAAQPFGGNGLHRAGEHVTHVCSLEGSSL